jgi:hypothetical protein
MVKIANTRCQIFTSDSDDVGEPLLLPAILAGLTAGFSKSAFFEFVAKGHSKPLRN